MRKIIKKTIAVAMSFALTFGMISVQNVSDTDVKAKAATGFTQYDFLKTDGTAIKNNYGRGNNIYLRGTNIGNLFVQESWMSSTSATDQKTIINALTSRFGQNKALELLDLYESNYFTEDDIERCKNMGMSVIRVPFTYFNLYKQSGNSWVLRDDAFTRLDWIVNECSERGIYVILDLHGAFGSQNGMDHSGEVINEYNDVTFFSNETLMSQTLNLWRVVASHYAGNPAVAGYDTLNEPAEKATTTTTRHWNFYDRMYDTIRSVDSDHIIIMESCWGTGNLPNPSNYGWTNVMYEYHHYPWDYVADTQANYDGQVNAINSLVSSVNNANYGVPTFIGEFNCFDGDAKWQYVIQKMNDAGWHYTNWSYKSNGMGSWGIYHEYAGQGKVDPWNDSESSIRTKWGSTNVGTNVNDRGVTYNNMITKLPGTIYFADKALTNDDYFYIKAQINSKYTTADNYGQSKLVANRDAANEWEQFRIIRNSDGTYSFQSRANNNFLCAVFDDEDTEAPIVARSNKINDWEKFYLEDKGNGTYALRTYTNSKYVQADINDTTSGILHASGASVGTWEVFEIASVTGNASIPGQSETPTQAPTEQPVTEAPTTQALPANTQVIPGTINVSSYAAKSDGVTVSTSGGTTYAGNFNDGSFITFNVNAQTTADYQLNLKLAAGDAQWNADSITVSVDGNAVKTVSVPASTGWENFLDVPVRINALSSGAHTVTLTVVGGACNIANFTAEYAGEEIATLPSESSTVSANRVVGYMPSWRGSSINKVDFSALTHCMLAFFRYQNGTVINDFSQSDITNIVNKCHSNGVKVSLALGGGGGFTYNEQPFDTQAKRTTLINTLMGYVHTYNLDGVDIDIEVSDSTMWSSFPAFVQELSAALKAEDKILTMAVSTWFTNPIPNSAYQYFDFLNLMAYDAAFGDGPVAPWSTIYEQVNYYKNRGMRDDQLVIGVPFYGYDSSGNYIGYDEIISRNADYRNYDYAGNIYYNGEQTIREKAEYSKSYGGIMIWEIGEDSFGQYSLLQVIKDTMATEQPVTATITPVPGTVPVDSYMAKSSDITISTSGTTTYAGNLNAGSELSYYIDAASKGDYTLTLNLAAGDAQWNATNFIVKINNEQVATVPVTGSTGWETFIAHTTTINLPLKGQYKISIQSQDGACNVGNFTLTKNEDVTEVPTQAPTTVAPTTQAPTTQAPTTQAPTQAPTEAPTVKPADGIRLNVTNSSSNYGLEGTYNWGTGYTYIGQPFYPQATASHKYLVVTYTGNITDIRIGNDYNPPTAVYWFKSGMENGTDHSFVTASGSAIPENGNNTTVVIDLEKSGTDGTFFNNFHIHTGSTGTTGSLTISEAYLTDTNPVEPQTQAPTTVAPTTQAPTTVAPTTVAPTTVAPTTVAPTTQAPTTQPPTEKPTEPPTEAPTEKPTEAPTTVPPTEPPTEAPKPTYTVTIDGDFVASVKEGNTYTLPSASIAGYEYDGKMYKVGSSVTVNSDMNFESVEISSDYRLSYLMNANSGIQYKMEVVGPVTSDIKGAGAVLVTASVYKLFKNVTKSLAPARASVVTASEIAQDGTFKVGLAGLSEESAYIEGRRARAYLDITFTGNGETTPTTVYGTISDESSLRAMATITRNSPSFRYMSNANKEGVRIISGIN